MPYFDVQPTGASTDYRTDFDSEIRPNMLGRASQGPWGPCTRSQPQSTKSSGRGTRSGGMGEAGTRNRRHRRLPAGARQTRVICRTTLLTCPQHGLLTSRTIQAHCTFLPPPDLARLAEYGTSVAHCPLSNAYFSAEPFRLREALNAGVKVGLGTDIAGGYSVDIMQAMRQAVVVSRMREGQRIMQAGGESDDYVSIDWKDALYLATAGGAAAMGLPNGVGTFAVGSPFDAQHSESSSAEKKLH